MPRYLLRKKWIIFIVSVSLCVFWQFSFVFEISNERERFDTNHQFGLLYYGSNKTIADEWNTEGKLHKYADPNNPYLVKRFPRCLSIGVAKAGNTALRHFMAWHPSIKISIPEEPEFFNKDIYNEGFHKYLDMMPYSFKDELTYDKSPGYFQSPKALQHIYEFDQKLKFILVVRNPVERSLSHYVHFIKRKNNAVTIKDIFLNASGALVGKHVAVKMSRYAVFLERWLGVFERRQIHIVDGDNLVRNPYYELSRVENFLNIKNYFTEDKFHYNKTRGFYCFTDGKRDHCSGNFKDDIATEIRNSEDIDIDLVKQKMYTYFKPFNEKFYRLSGMTFNWDLLD